MDNNSPTSTTVPVTNGYGTIQPTSVGASTDGTIRYDTIQPTAVGRIQPTAVGTTQPIVDSTIQPARFSASTENGTTRYGSIQPAAVGTSNENGEILTHNPGPLWTARKLWIFFLLSFVYFLNWCYVGLLAPFFPDEATKFGIESTEIGLIFAIYSLVAFPTSFVYGSYLVPKMGPYFVLLSGLFLNGGATITFGFVNLLPKGQIFAVFCLITRGVSAIGGAACETAVMVILIQEFRDNLTTVIGMLELFTGLGFTVGPFLGGSLYSLGGFRLPLFVVGGLLLAAFPLVWLFLPRTDYIENTTSRGTKVWKEALANPGVIVMCITMLVGVASISFLDPTLQPHALKFGLNSTGVGLLFLVFSITYMLCTPFLGRLLQKKNWKRIFLVFGFFLSGVCLLFIGPAPFMTSFVPKRNVWILAVSMGIAGACNAFSFVTFMPELLECCYERGMKKDLETDSMATGLYNGFSNFGGFIGPFAGGVLVEYLNFEWTSTILAGCVFVQTCVMFIFFSCSRRRPPGKRKVIDVDPEKEHLINNKSNDVSSQG